MSEKKNKHGPVFCYSQEDQRERVCVREREKEMREMRETERERERKELFLALCYTPSMSEYLLSREMLSFWSFLWGHEKRDLSIKADVSAHFLSP